MDFQTQRPGGRVARVRDRFLPRLMVVAVVGAAVVWPANVTADRRYGCPLTGAIEAGGYLSSNAVVQAENVSLLDDAGKRVNA